MARQDVLNEIQQTLGAVPEWLNGIPDPQLEHQWGLIRWLLSDTQLTARDKALVAFGAAAAVHCSYWTPFHEAQLRLSGMGDAEVQEAAGAAAQVVGFSTYLHGVEYSVEQFKQELDAAVAYITSQQP
jgi:AhpD family alkylhydroperoxidase